VYKNYNTITKLSLSILVSSSDLALYEVKAKGHNRIEVAQEGNW
jgi:GGDEF domain-containing protein